MCRFSIAKGETVGIVGESGCGKSTTARLLMHLMKRDAGDIIYDGMQVGRALSLRELRRGMQMVFQDSYASLNPRLTIEESIAFGPKVHGMADGAARALARELLGKVGLRPEIFANRYPHEISGGQRQRVNIARALALSPRLVILDEAVSALDKSVEAQVLNLLADLKREFGLTYLFISHDLNVVRYISDRVLVMYLGEVVELGPVDKVWDAPAHPYTRALLAAMPSSDPDNRTETPPISGDPPNPIDPPSGCRFHTRCPFAEPLCANATPKLTALDTMGHQAACYMAIPGSGHSRAPANSGAKKRHDKTDSPKEVKAMTRCRRRARRRRGRRAHRQFDRAGLRRLCAGRRHAAVRSRARDASCSCRPRRCRNERRAGLDVADRGREGDRDEAGVLARGDAILPAPHRAMAAAAQRLHGDRGRGRAGGRRCRRCGARQGQGRRARCTACRWRTRTCITTRARSSTCGSKIRRDFVAHDDLDRAAAAEGRRHGPARLAADGGVRLRADRPQPALRRGAQSLECRSHHRRLVVGLGLGGRRAADLCGARLGHRRLDPDARAFLRRHRIEDHGRPRQPRRRDAAVAIARHRRAAGADRGGLRAAAGPDGGRRSRGSDRVGAAGAGLHGGDQRLDQGPEDRRARPPSMSTISMPRSRASLDETHRGAEAARAPRSSRSNCRTSASSPRPASSCSPSRPPPSTSAG